MAATVVSSRSIDMSPPSCITRDADSGYCTISVSQPTLSAALFPGTTVYIAIDDRTIYNVTASAMIRVGATICTGSAYLADIVITDSTGFSMPQIRGGRGSKLVGLDTKSPRVVTLTQIPWVFETPKKASPLKPIEKPNRKRMIVVSDDCGRFRPVFKYLPEKIKLHFSRPKVRGVTCCPFAPVPEHCLRTRPDREKMVVVPTGPADKGFCELCQISYDIAEEHHASFDHRRNSGERQWRVFDEMAEVLNKRTVW